MHYDISFVIPAYNVGEYLDETINAIMNQESINPEIIIVNDGSTDNTLDICKKYSTKYSFVKLIDKKNEGVSVARNIGIEQSTGDYICFIDGDDYYLCDFAKKFYDLCKKNDLDIIRGHYTIVENGENKDFFPKKTFCDKKSVSGIEFLSITLKNKNNEVVPVLGLFKRSLLVNNSITFPKGIAFCEDQLFYLKSLLVNGCKVMDSEINFYAYRMRNGSATNCNFSQKKVDDVFYIYKNELSLIEKYPSYMKEIASFASGTLSQFFKFYNLADIDNRRNMIVQFKKNFNKICLKYPYSFKNYIKFLLAYKFPFVLRLFYRRKK